MKYFIDCEFIEDFYKSFTGRKRHFIDLISIAVVREDGKAFYRISKDYKYTDASDWVKENVITPLYLETVQAEYRNIYNVKDFHKQFGLPNDMIRDELLKFFGCWRDQIFWRAPEGIEIYGYYSDYDWVLFCSLFGKMIDLPKGFPMLCYDLKQMMQERGLDKEWKERNCPEPENAHLAIEDAKWNRKLFFEMTTANNSKAI